MPTTLMRNLTFFGLLSTLVFFAMGSAVRFAVRTNDDSRQLNQYLRGLSKNQVLGASSRPSKYCPEETPVVGWIDFSGKKVLPSNLPENQIPSACFKSYEEATSEGYVVE
jgi:hypothetical protein